MWWSFNFSIISNLYFIEFCLYPTGTTYENSGKYKMSRKITSSFNGKIYEIPGVCVDNFENPSGDGAKAYFLSHFHTDHTVGLNKDALKEKLVREKTVFIYATKMTAAIILYNNSDLKDYIKTLNAGSNLICLPSDPESNQPELYINVTLIPAGHCLGSSMFLFETISLKVLFTGDFRIRLNDLPKYSAFHKDGEVITLDALYVDTTFIDSHESFPKRSDSIEEAILLIKGFLDSGKDQLVLLDTSANFGYEHVFNQIYKTLGVKVYVDERRWTFYRTIQHMVPGVTNNADDTRIFLKHIPESRTPATPPKRVRFSAIRWDDWHEDRSSITENRNTIYVCFSTHCSSIELVYFVEYLSPIKVYGFPKPYKVKASPVKESDGEKYASSPRKSAKKDFCSPTKPYKDKKVDDALLRKILG